MKQTKWFDLLKDKYNSGITNTFILTGNIGDYAIPGVVFEDYLINSLKELKMSAIFTYNFSKGSSCKWENDFVEHINKYDWQDMIKKLDTIKKSIKQDYLRRDIENVEKKIREYKCGQFNNDWDQMLQDLRSNIILKNGETSRNAYIIEYPEFLVGNFTNDYDENSKKRLIDLHKVLNSKEFLNSNNLIIFITETLNNVNSIFKNSNSRSVPINVEYPNEEERQETIKYLMETGVKKFNWEISEAQFSKLTAGLTRFNIEDIYLLAEASGVLNKKMIMDRKKELMYKEFGEIIELYDTDGYSLRDFAGQDHLKSYFKEVVVEPILNGDLSIVPKGLLYVGPPGTGKTYFAKCSAGEAQMNCVEFKMSKILDKYVGEAEKNLEKAFHCFEALSPLIVFMDEMEQQINRGENDSNSVMKNIFGMFLAFMSEPSHRGKIIFVGASNYPNRLDEALKRSGRFDKKIPFLPPNLEERINVFKIHLSKIKYPYSIKDYNKLGEMTNGYTQAEIENIIIKALEIAKRKKLNLIDDDVLIYAKDCILSTQNEKIEEMVQIALRECNDLELLPKEYVDKKKNM